jgi:hypothetical protein
MMTLLAGAAAGVAGAAIFYAVDRRRLRRQVRSMAEQAEQRARQIGSR